MINSKDIINQAEREVKDEMVRRFIDDEKVRIRARRNYWFPWRFRFQIINLNKEKIS